MRLIIIVILSFCINQIRSQDISNRLLDLEIKAFESNEDSIKSYYYNQKINLYLSNGILKNQLFNDVRRVDYTKLDQQDKINFLWNTSILSYLNNYYEDGNYYWNEYIKYSQDSSLNSLTLGLLIYRNVKSVNSSKIVFALAKNYPKEWKNLKCILNETDDANWNKIHNRRIYSTIFPGLGLMINGNVAKGFTSSTLFFGTLYISKLLLTNNLYVNGTSWLILVVSKFYFGNIKLTETLTKRRLNTRKNKLTKQCELIFSKTMEHNPIQFKY